MVDETKITGGKYDLQTIDICTQTDNYILQDGFKSFPSGHSSGTDARFLANFSTIY
jgi:membrane-associated phospholipid phosphatase